MKKHITIKDEVFKKAQEEREKKDHKDKYKERSLIYTFPYVADNTLMIYTLEESLRFAIFQYQVVESDFIARPINEIAKISDKVTERLEKIYELSDQKINEIASKMKLKNGKKAFNSKEEMIKAVIETVNQSVEDDKNNTRKLLSQVREKVGTNKTIKDQTKEMNKMWRQRKALRIADTKEFEQKMESIISQIDTLNSRNIEDILLMYRNHIVAQLRRVFEKTPSSKRTPATYYGGFLPKDVIDLGREKSGNFFAVTTILRNALKEIEEKGVLSKKTNEEVKHFILNTSTIVLQSLVDDAYEMFIKKGKVLIDKYYNYLTDLQKEADRENLPIYKMVKKDGEIEYVKDSSKNLTVGNLTELQEFLNNHNEDNITVAQKLGWMAEVLETVRYAAMPLYDVEGNAGKVVHILPGAINDKDITDILINFDSFKINISVKSNQSVANFFGELKNAESSKSKTPTFIKDAVSVLANDEEFQFTLLSNMATALCRKNSGKSNYFNFLGQIRYEYARISAIKFLLGYLYMQPDSPSKSEGSKIKDKAATEYIDYLNDYREFPVFLVAEGKTVLLTDVLKSMINNLTRVNDNDSTQMNKKSIAPVLYNKDRGIQKPLKESVFKDLYDLKDLGYSFKALYKYNDNPNDYKDINSFKGKAFKSIRNAPQNKGKTKKAWMDPYRKKDLSEALKIMKEMTTLIRNPENLFPILTNGIQIFAQNTVNEILKKEL